MSKYLERYDPAALRRYLERQGGKHENKGSDHIDYHMPDGKVVPCPARGSIVTTLVAAKVADILGLTRQELSVAVMGSEASRHGKIRKGIRRESLPASTRSEVLRAIDRCASSLGGIRSRLTGSRDSAYYKAVSGELARAEQALTAADHKAAS